MTRPTINGKPVEDSEALAALNKVLDSKTYSQFHNGDQNLTEPELGAVLDVYHPDNNKVGTNDLAVHALKKDGLTATEFKALAKEYQRQFPKGSKKIDTRLWATDASSNPTDFTEEKEIGSISLNRPLTLDVASLSKHFKNGSHLRATFGEYILDANRKTILLFEENQGSGFTKLYSPLSKRDLAKALLVLPSDQLNYFSKLLELPELTEAEIQEAGFSQKQVNEDQTFLDSYLQLPNLTKVSRDLHSLPDQKLVRGVMQKEYAITHANSAIPVVGTSGLGPCIAVTFYYNHQAAVAHIDATTRVDSLETILEEMGASRDLKNVQIRLVGGDGSSRELAIKILKFFKEKGLQPMQADILSKEHPTSLAIDSRNGDVYFGYAPINNGENAALRAVASGMQGMDGSLSSLRKDFDGRK